MEQGDHARRRSIDKLTSINHDLDLRISCREVCQDVACNTTACQLLNGLK